MVKFSGYWEVKGNPKPTATLGHIEQLNDKDIDILFCDKNYPTKCKQVHIDPLSTKYIKTFSSPTFLKFGLACQTDIFQKLVSIWTSKMLLFKVVADLYPAENDFIWVDCVHNANYDYVASSNTTRCCLNKYDGKNTRKMYHTPFNDKHFVHLDTYLSAQVIKINRQNLEATEKKYLECLKFANNNYNLYDEEIVLSLMYKTSPQLFEIIN